MNPQQVVARIQVDPAGTIDAPAPADPHPVIYVGPSVEITCERGGQFHRGHEDELRRAPKFFLGRTAPGFLWHPLHMAFEAAAFVGLLRLTQSSPAQDKDPSQMTQFGILGIWV